ncbi:MAG: beta-lactamase domain protein [Lachnospiraceae bacterium]|jgi:flavorubredoxin|nr:beta-lactamase domain protein [Lachnospiraceae bacterium]
MNAKSIAEETYVLSMNVEDILFEGAWEIPNGVSINSYIIKGEKTAVIDGFCGWDGAPETLFTLLSQINIYPESIEYLIINHMEPDHSGWIEKFKLINPNFKILCSKKAQDLLAAFYGQTENITCVKDGDTVDLGDGHVLSFTEIPNVHWPDTIATLDTATGTLFSCDAFGGFGKIGSSIFADDLDENELKKYEVDTIRYFSNILGTFSPQAKKAVLKCENLPIKMIAPGHGYIWREPGLIMDAYSKYADYQKGPAKEEITLVWSSMYGMTEKAVQFAVKVLESQNIKFHIHQVPEDSWGTVITSAWTSTGLILAMPTYEFKMFPPMASTLEEMGKKKIQNRKVFSFGSYGWSGGAQKELAEITTRLGMNWDFVEPVEFLGAPREEELQKIENGIIALVNEVKALCSNSK